MLSFGALKQAIGVGPHQVQARRGSVLGSAPGSANTSPQASTAPVPGAAAAAAASPAGVPAARPPVAGVPRGSMVVNSNPSRVSPAASSVPPVPPLASSTTASPAASSAAPPVAPGSADANARRASLTMSPGQRSLIPGAPAGTPGAVPAAVPAAAPAVAAVGAPGAPSSFLENLKGGMNQLFTSVSVGVNLGPAPVVHATATTAADGSVTYTNALAGQQQTPLAAGANRSRTNSDAALEQEILNKGVVTMPTHTSAVASSLLYTARRSSLATGNGAASPTSPTGVASHGGIAAGGGGIAASGAARRGSGVSAAAAAAAAGGERRPSLVPRSPSPAAGTSALPVVTAAMLSAAPTADELKEAKRYRYLGGYSLSLSIEQVLHTATATSGSSSSAATTSSTPSPSPVASLTAGKTLSFRVHFTPKADTNNAFAIGYILDGSPFPTSAVVKLAKCPADGKVFCLANFNRRAVIKLFGRMVSPPFSSFLLFSFLFFSSSLSLLATVLHPASSLLAPFPLFFSFPCRTTRPR